MRFQPKRKFILGAIALAACSFGGGAYAATQDSDSAASPRAFFNDVAKRLGVTPQQLAAAFQGAEIDQLNAAVKAGKLTQAQANAIEQRIRSHEFPPFGFPEFGPRGFFRFHHGGPVLGAAAKYLGISASELRSELRSGKSLERIAREHGKTAAGLRQAIRSALPPFRLPSHFRPGFYGAPPAAPPGPPPSAPPAAG